ncbi:MAG: thiamine pyrophosphate-binding protein [Candidatus Binatia bacterium]|jgi:benzoylformate decarboxylase|nr:thiamine pyrophosphate-binding protein [Candidatus Binatia bacterium]
MKNPKIGKSRLDRPQNIGKPRMRWGSDVVAEVTQRLDLKYIALVPGASYRGFHDSIVNYLGNENPQMVICLHEEHAVSIADGYGKVTEKPMAVALHSNVGLMHATMPIFNAWCDRTPMVIFGATGPVDAHRRRPWIDWIHTSKDQASMIRHYTKWDDQPASPQAAVESVLRANQITRTAPHGPVYVCLDAGLQEAPLTEEIAIPDPARFAPAPPPSASRSSVLQVLKIMGKASFPLILMGRVSRNQEDWDRRVRLAEALGAAVLTSSNDPAAFPTMHPLHAAAPCLNPTKEATALIKRADVILSLDWLDLAGYLRLGLGASQTQKPATKEIIHCSLDSYRTNGWSMDYQALPAVDIPILARSDDFVSQLLDGLGVKTVRRVKTRPAIKRIGHWSRTTARRGGPQTEQPMRLTDMALTIRDFAAGKPVTFARLPLGWPGEACRFDGPLSFLGNDGGGAVGTGPGHTVGAALALKDTNRLTIGVIGDGDYLMGANALWTASHMDIPVMIVVADNRSFFNDEMHQERVAVARSRPVQNRWIGQRIDDPPADLVAMAKAQGFAGGDPVTTAETLAAEIERGARVVTNGGRYIIDAVVRPGYANSGPDQRAGSGKKN